MKKLKKEMKKKKKISKYKKNTQQTRVCNKSSMMGITSGAENAHPSGAHVFISICRGSCGSIFSFLCSVW